MKVISFILLILGTIYFTSCEKEITISTPSYTEKPSIQGIIEPDSFPILYFNKTTQFLSATTKKADLVLRNAIIKISGGGSTDILRLDSLYDRIYCQFDYFYKGNILTQWNTEYNLDISYNGSKYNASTKTNLKAAVIDSVSYTAAFNDVYGEHEGVIVYFKDFGGSIDYYRYEQLRPVDTTMKHASLKLSLTNGCIGKDTIIVLEQGRSVYTDQNLDGQQMKIVIEPAFSHRNGLKTIVKIQSIDKAMFDFYDQIDKQKLAQFNPFVEPIFLKEGQFGSTAIGFFGCRTRSNGKDFVFPE